MTNKKNKIEILTALLTMYKSKEETDFNEDVQDYLYSKTKEKHSAFNYCPYGEVISFYGKDYKDVEQSELYDMDDMYEYEGQLSINKELNKECFYFLNVEFLNDWLSEWDNNELTVEAVREYKKLIKAEIEKLK